MRLKWVHRVVELVDLVKDGVKEVDKGIDACGLQLHLALD